VETVYKTLYSFHSYCVSTTMLVSKSTEIATTTPG